MIPLPFATTGPPCMIEPWVAGCGGIAEARPWIAGIATLLAIPTLLLVMLLLRRDR